jgi:hypothetical protein
LQIYLKIDFPEFLPLSFGYNEPDLKEEEGNKRAFIIADLPQKITGPCLFSNYIILILGNLKLEVFQSHEQVCKKGLSIVPNLCIRVETNVVLVFIELEVRILFKCQN